VTADLVALVADKDMEHALRGMLQRPQALGTRKLRFRVIVHPQHDPACATRGVGFLSGLNFANEYRHALLLFDHEGSGREGEERKALQARLDEEFRRFPWGDRARAVVLAPELETWVWSNSPHLDDVVGWKGRRPPLRRWLKSEGWLEEHQIKPRRPKEAFHAALRRSATPRSASLFLQLAERVSLANCVDDAFLDLRNTLRTWFPSEDDGNR